MPLSQEDIISLIKAYDHSFASLISLYRLPTTYPQKNTTYVTKYEASSEDDSPKQARELFIETGSKTVLEAEVELLKTITEKTSLAVPKVLKVDNSTDLIPEPYLILAYETKTSDGDSDFCHEDSLTTLRNVLNRDDSDIEDRNKELIQLQLGSHLRELHAIDNMWFGPPGDEAEWGECISWQEAFTLLLETALMELEARELDKQDEGGDDLKSTMQELRRALASAIAFYLFDDVEAPSLIWCANLDWPSYAYTVSTEPRKEDEDADGSPILLSDWGGPMCFWGDPLMEGAFRAPEKALLEGYGEPGPIMFSRQRTKRLWYTAYAALCQWLGALDEAGAVDGTTNDETKKVGLASDGNRFIEERAKRAKEIFLETVKQLKDAPCY